MEKRIAGAEAVGSHKTSMLQDIEQGKPLEIEGMLGVVVELAALTEVEVPTLNALCLCRLTGSDCTNRAREDQRDPGQVIDYRWNPNGSQNSELTTTIGI